MKRNQFQLKKIWQKMGAVSLSLLFFWTMNAPVVLAQQEANRKAPPPPAMPKSVRKGENKVKLVKPVQTTKSKEPTDLEVMTLRVFPEPLTPMSGKEVKGENADIVKALDAFKLKNNYEDISDLTGFLKKYPKSRWRPSLELNVGLRRQEAGYISDSLSLWKSAWESAKNEKGRNQRAVADRAVAEMLYLDARLGRMPELEKYLAEIKGREMNGAVEQMVEGAREGMLRMQAAPQDSFKCGPYAVNTLLYMNDEVMKRHPTVDATPSTAQGTNLAQVKDVADQVGLRYQMAKRSNGAPIITPAVMHWKLDHFAAITSLAKGRYHVIDPTFDRGGNLWLTPKVIETESDGYFLVPEGPLPSGWRTVERAEAENVWGKGGSSECDPGKPPTDPQKCPKGDCCDSGGMAIAKVFTMQNTLKVMDTPLGYSPPVGPSINNLINYNHMEVGQPVTFTFSNLGPNWSFN